MAIVRNRSNDAAVIDKSNDNNRFDITPSDTLFLPVPIDAVYVDGLGDIRMDDGKGGSVTLTYAVGGPYFLGGVVRIYATGTTATGLVGVASKALR